MCMGVCSCMSHTYENHFLKWAPRVGTDVSVQGPLCVCECVCMLPFMVLEGDLFTHFSLEI